MKTKVKPMPSLVRDKDAERFVETTDISQYDLSDFKPMNFELAPKSAVMHMRLPQNLLDALKAKAKAKGIPYTSYVRMLLENDVAQ
jgi:predicted DNA binding CopG/RHH family protein